MISWEQILDIKDDRKEYFVALEKVKSPLQLLPKELLNDLILSRADIASSGDIHLKVAQQLETVGTVEAVTRAEFIRLQCKGDNGEAYFLQHCEKWGIPLFKEDILTANDFKFGFLHTFRDHTTSWSEDYFARNWFYASAEAQFARRWEFWSCDKGIDELLYSEEGNYGELLKVLLNKYEDYGVLKNQIFSKEFLEEYIRNLDEAELGYSKGEFIEQYVKLNPSW